MRLYGPSSTRATPTDRNPSTVANGGGPAGPFVGGTTNIIATYTVPVSRRAQLGTIGGYIFVGAALAAAQRAILSITMTPNGGALTILHQIALQGGQVLGTTERLQGANYQLKAGDQIDLRLGLDAGAGTCGIGGGLQGVEYDA